MKKIHLLSTVLLLALSCISCAQDEAEPEFTLDTQEIVLGAEGGVKQVRVTIPGSWTAAANQPWVQISPANGNGGEICRIQVDSTLLAGTERNASVRFTMLNSKESKTLRISQAGFDKALSLLETAVALENYATPEKRFFDVELTSNVKFEIEIPEEAASWLTYDTYRFELDCGARPRTTKIRFKWEGNSETQQREVKVSFRTAEEDLTRHDALVVTQDRSPEITPDRAGDSLTLVIVERKLDAMTKWDKSELLPNWRSVRLWEEGDKGCTPERVGRVRAVEFEQFLTKEGIPDDIRNLTYLETLSFFSNGNKQLYSLDAGKAITELIHLKNLRIYSFGLTSLPDEFKNLKNLVTLDLSSNNFQNIPAVITPENFPALKHLSLVNTRRYYTQDLTLSKDPKEKWGGLYDEPATLERLFKWDNLETLLLSNNIIRGEIPAMKNHTKYTAEEVMQNDTLKTAAHVLVGSPKILPKCRDLRIGLNYLHGELPQWMLIHPYLTRWGFESVIFNQNRAFDDNGVMPGFTNIPQSFDYYYELYPLLKPKY